MKILITVFIFLILLNSCSAPVENVDLLRAKDYERAGILAFRNGNINEAICKLKKSFHFYARYDNVQKESDILLMLAKIDKKNSKKYLLMAKKFYSVLDKKRKDELNFTSALLNRDISAMKSIANSAQSDKLRALSKIYLYKWTKNKEFLNNFNYNNKDYIYSFYLYVKSQNSKKAEKIRLLKEALKIDKKLQNRRFIKRDLAKLYKIYIKIDKEQAMQYKQRLELMND